MHIVPEKKIVTIRYVSYAHPDILTQRITIIRYAGNHESYFLVLWICSYGECNKQLDFFSHAWCHSLF